MVFEKNSNLILNVCKVLIRSTEDVVDIPSLQKIYHTPSKITYSSSGRNTENGNLFTKNLRISYPGLSDADFSKFNELLKGRYQVYAELEDGDVYEVATTQFPMSCNTSFSFQNGHEVVFSSTAPAAIKFITKIVPGQQAPPLEEMFDYDLDFNLN